MQNVQTIVRVVNPAHDEHHRTTIKPVETGDDLVVWVEIHTDAQRTHAHHFADLSRFGDAICYSCGATAWSESWVADGVFGDNTYSWADLRYRDYAERAWSSVTEVAMERESLLVVAATERVILAALDPSEPARRPGLPVPAMEFGRLD